ncbi:MAG: twin-arginine translocase TatA/TatE family subunit [Deltaproteobacteria bacterium]|nr:twin-arginine translocase TatA/TatE family subunit [Deltaproteobacteria bacterium]
MGIPAPTELLLILGIVLVIFGGKRIPEIMGGLGQGIKVLKKSLDPDDEPVQHTQTQSTQIPPQEAKPVESAGVRADVK